jgi:hypothetical protein
MDRQVIYFPVMDIRCSLILILAIQLQVKGLSVYAEHTEDSIGIVIKHEDVKILQRELSYRVLDLL